MGSVPFSLRVREFLAVLEGWRHAHWRRLTHHDLKGDLQMDCRLASLLVSSYWASLWSRQ